MGDRDFLLAQQLQEEFDKESTAFLVSRYESIDLCENGSANTLSSQFQRHSVIDPSLEISDPNPDVRALFIQFNDQYFWGKLAGVEVKWSPRMTLCAGICHYEGRGGLCSIRLSVPLLKLRPRKDLVETLLHEMIHALLFVTDNDRDHNDHGPNFQKHMHRINKASGAHITIYHDFHDEVDSYRQHWWRCDGPCRNRKPYFGWVKRAMNRPPSARDPWWAEHALTCGGTYTKVKEPEGYGVKKKDSKEQKKDKEGKGMSKDIRSFLQVPGNTTQGRGSMSDTNKKISSTVTSSGFPTDSTIPSSTTNSTLAGNSAGSTDNDFSLDWGGGIWTPEKNTSNQLKHWTAVETKNNEEVKPKSSSSGEVQTFKGRGNELGRGSGAGESWLAKMRKEWSKEIESANPASSSHHTDTARGSGHWNTEKSDRLNSFPSKKTPETESDPEPLKSESDDKGRNTPLTQSDDSHHSSFHVSTCEEDNWPTPEKLKIKEKHVKRHSTNEQKRKRVITEMTSSDEDECDLQVAIKASRFDHNSPSDSDSDNIVQWMTAKAQTKNKGERDTENNVNIQSGTTESTFVKHQADKRVPLGHRPLSKTDTSTSCSEANGSSHSSGPPFSGCKEPVSLVACPVCQRKVPAVEINVHLDTCLS